MSITTAPTDPADLSSISQPEIPFFKPNVPDYLLEDVKKNKVEKHLVERISIISQQNNWQNEKIQNIYGYTKTINGKVIMLEEFRHKQEEKEGIVEALENFKKENNVSNKKLKLWLGVLFLMLVYPLYLSVFSQLGPGGVVEKLITTVVQ